MSWGGTSRSRTRTPMRTTLVRRQQIAWHAYGTDHCNDCHGNTRSWRAKASIPKWSEAWTEMLHLASINLFGSTNLYVHQILFWLVAQSMLASTSTDVWCNQRTSPYCTPMKLQPLRRPLLCSLYPLIEHPMTQSRFRMVICTGDFPFKRLFKAF